MFQMGATATATARAYTAKTSFSYTKFVLINLSLSIRGHPLVHVPQTITQKHHTITYQSLRELLDTIHWLPPSCAYRRLHEGKNLPRWHYLNTGSRQSILKAKKSAAGRCISEEEIQDDDIEDYIVRWVR